MVVHDSPDHGADVADAAPVRGAPIDVRAYAGLAAILVGLWLAAGALSGAAHQQRHRRSTQLGAEGSIALEQGRHGEAAYLLRQAVALEPDDPALRLTLGKALAGLDRPQEALPYVKDVLAADPVNGEANLVLARLLRRTGDDDGAEAAYYRAIYGRWRSGQQGLRVQPRLELVSLFRDAGRRERLRAALLELSGAFPGDRALQLQAGRELLEAGFADDAARLLRTLVERFADPGAGVSLLAEAEFARGHLIDAYAAAGRALARDPGDRAAARLHRLSARILSLDPDQPRISSSARRDRIRHLLIEARSRLVACAPPSATAASPTILPAVDRWVTRRSADVEVGRALLAAAASSVAQQCPAPAKDDAAGLLLQQLGAGLAS
ncbi:hypothetical protein TBR22_A41940 [Luteitalea sp. TBR-22]|uniref:tetratricopeptide repeat protein n=1 Tax=Luteitalea sp. TBR-22 TaxID=2802971 RepID=UPI001AF9C0C0|nr:tetratricopeptide repeat protein [Luteitalea sp. TBR-22]BCS34968.1 hypothetical protein TBR22_A41940 [Luteitalea sp. TBR-22]